VSLAPVPSEGATAPVPSVGATCANCSAPLVADQRYCLACGHPCSPVRLAFLDVLQAESHPQLAPGPYAAGGAGLVSYAPPQDPAGAEGWLRRFSPLFAVLSVLLMAMIVGLLVGHWVTQSKAPGPQVLKVEGLTAAAPIASAASATPAATAASSTQSPSTGSSAATAKSEAEEVATEAKAEKTQAAKVEHAKVVKPNSSKLKKLSGTTGRKHEEEINALGAQPIETGG
jgi:hypothetical protein